MEKKILTPVTCNSITEFTESRNWLMDFLDDLTNKLEKLPYDQKKIAVQRIDNLSKYDDDAMDVILCIIKDLQDTTNLLNSVNQKNRKLELYVKQLGGDAKYINWNKISDFN